jgi:ureidoglycolate dehydrogenase (NAD+)
MKIALEKVGVPSHNALQVVDALIQTSLWGIDSHGIARLPHYLTRLETGSIISTPNMTFTSTGAATGYVDGGHGLGIVVSRYAMDRAIDLALESGAGFVGVISSSHCGAIGLYTRQATRKGCLGIAFTHSDSFMVPFGGNKAFFGTNPISIALPSEDPSRPLCVDMATSVVPWNRIMNARRDGSEVPESWGVDMLGSKTSKPEDIVAVNPMAEHKGYALAFLIDMLCGPLNGMPFGPHITPMYESLDKHRNLGSLMIAVDLSRFPSGDMLPHVISSAIHEVKRGNEGIRYPGEPEYLAEEIRSKGGIPVEISLLKQLDFWAQKLGIPKLSRPI